MGVGVADICAFAAGITRHLVHRSKEVGLGQRDTAPKMVYGLHIVAAAVTAGAYAFELDGTRFADMKTRFFSQRSSTISCI